MNANMCAPAHFPREDSEGLFCFVLYSQGVQRFQSLDMILAHGLKRGRTQLMPRKVFKSVQGHKTFATAFYKSRLSSLGIRTTQTCKREDSWATACKSYDLGVAQAQESVFVQILRWFIKSTKAHEALILLHCCGLCCILDFFLLVLVENNVYTLKPIRTTRRNHSPQTAM